jgi:hypothetical protein
MVTLEQIRAAFPGWQITGAGRYGVRLCGRIVLTASPEESRAVYLAPCGMFCKGVRNHGASVIAAPGPASAPKQVSRSWRKMVHDA